MYVLICIAYCVRLMSMNKFHIYMYALLNVLEYNIAVILLKYTLYTCMYVFIMMPMLSGVKDTCICQTYTN